MLELSEVAGLERDYAIYRRNLKYALSILLPKGKKLIHPPESVMSCLRIKENMNIADVT